jgi:hypothetical protein
MRALVRETRLSPDVFICRCSFATGRCGHDHRALGAIITYYAAGDKGATRGILCGRSFNKPAATRLQR